MQGHTAIVLPVAEDTWEVSANLAGDVQETEPIPLPFPGPVEIVGLYPSIVIDGAAQGPPLRAPTLDDVAVLIDVNARRRLTNRLGRTTAAAPGSSLVTLGAMSTRDRWIRHIVRNASPDLTIQFRWKADVTGGAFFEDSIVSLAFYLHLLNEPREQL